MLRNRRQKRRHSRLSRKARGRLERPLAESSCYRFLHLNSETPADILEAVKSVSLLCFVTLATVAGVIVSCTQAAPPSDRVQAASAVRKAEDAARPEIAQLTLPSKSRYLTVHTRDGWENPFVTVQADTLLVRITHADANPSALNPGGYLRPTSA